MERQNKAQSIIARWFATQLSRGQFSSHQFNKRNRGVKKGKTWSTSSTTVFTLTVIAALILPLLPTADLSVAVAQGQTPDVSAPTVKQSAVTQPAVMQPAVMQPAVMQIEEEIATISSSAGATAQCSPTQILKLSAC